jgi:glycosyltransferase involved in cell wall biosynthesis
MKIAFLNIYNGVIDRGAETYVKELAARLSRKNEVTVFQSGEAAQWGPYEIARIPVNWDWKRKTGVGTLLGRLFLDYWSRQIFIFSLKAIPQILKEKYDVVIPVNGGWMPAIIRLITWLYGGKMIISGQSGIGWDDRNNLWCFPNTFIALSTQAKNWARKVNPLVKVEYIPNGVDTKKFTPKPLKPIPWDKSPYWEIHHFPKPVILCVGALTKAKRIDLVIKAVNKIKNASLLIVSGSSTRDNYLNNLACKLLGKRCSFMRIAYNDMPSIYQSVDVFTLPSASWQSFEIVLVEAMACGLGVVANNDPIRKEIVGEAGILVNPTKTVQYAKALEKASKINWENKPRKQAEKFDWDIIAEKYEKLFKTL